MRRRVETLHEGAHLLANAVIASTDNKPVDDAVEVAAFVVVGGLLESVLAWLDGSLKVTREALVTNFARTATAALTSAITPDPQVSPGRKIE